MHSGKWQPAALQAGCGTAPAALALQTRPSGTEQDAVIGAYLLPCTAADSPTGKLRGCTACTYTNNYTHFKPSKPTKMHQHQHQHRHAATDSQISLHLALACRDREDAPSSSVLSSPTYSTATSTSQRSPQLVQEIGNRVEQGGHRNQTPPTRR